MKRIKLADGQEIQLPSSMSDLDVQRVVKTLVGKLGELQSYEKGKEVVLINTQFPDFPKFPNIPELKDCSKLLKEFIDQDKKNKDDILKETKALNQSIAYLGTNIQNQTNELTKAINAQSEVLAELVNAYREPKKIIRDNNGRPEGIE
jgi:N-glycosylase/DNA lyase